MKAVRDDSDREIRILKHKLALTQGNTGQNYYCAVFKWDNFEKW